MTIIDRIRVLADTVRNIGLPSACRYNLNRLRIFLGKPAAGALRLQPKGVRYPITLRGGTSSDTAVFRQVFIEQEYLPIYDIPNVKRILDLGANTGMATVAFLNRFPDAEIVALEPDAENHRMCSLNVAAY